MPDDAELIAMTNGQRNVVQRTNDDAIAAAVLFAEHPANDAPYQRVAEAQLSSINRELRHDILERNLGHGSSPKTYSQYTMRWRKRASI